MTNDDEWATQVLDDDAPETKQQVRMADYSVELEMLTNIFDRLGEVIQAVVATAPGKARVPKIKRAPRPTTALDRVRNRRRYAAHQALVARVLPQQQAQPPPQVG